MPLHNRPLRVADFLWLIPPLPTATPAAAGDTEVWTTLTANAALSDHWLGQADLVARFGDAGDSDIYEIRYGGFLGYKVSGKVSLWVGYARIHRYAGGTTRTEERPRQQITADLGKLARANLSGRLRLEQRIRPGGGIGWRLRPQLRAAWPLGKSGLAAVLSHEGFVALNDTKSGQRAGYERMRNFAGVSVPLSAPVKAEIGYLNQYNFVRGRPDTVDHVGSLALTWSF